MGRTSKCHLGWCSLQCHTSPDWWGVEEGVSGLSEPANSTVASETEADQLKGREWPNPQINVHIQTAVRDTDIFITRSSTLVKVKHCRHRNKISVTTMIILSYWLWVRPGGSKASLYAFCLLSCPIYQNISYNATWSTSVLLSSLNVKSRHLNFHKLLPTYNRVTTDMTTKMILLPNSLLRDRNCSGDTLS